MSTIEQDQEEIAHAARRDQRHARERRTDPNPFSTSGARALWSMGYNNQRPDNLVDQSQNWRYWERGRQARILEDAEHAQPAEVSPGH